MVKRRGGVKDGTTGQLAVPWRRSASAGRTRWPNPEIRCFPHSRYTRGFRRYSVALERLWPSRHHIELSISLFIDYTIFTCALY